MRLLPVTPPLKMQSGTITDELLSAKLCLPTAALQCLQPRADLELQPRCLGFLSPRFYRMTKPTAPSIYTVLSCLLCQKWSEQGMDDVLKYLAWVNICFRLNSAFNDSILPLIYCKYLSFSSFNQTKSSIVFLFWTVSVVYSTIRTHGLSVIITNSSCASRIGVNFAEQKLIELRLRF